MRSVALKPQDLCHDLQFLPLFVEDGQLHAAADIRQLSLQMHERAFRADVLSRAFRDNVLAFFRLPLGAHQQRCEVARPCSQL